MITFSVYVIFFSVSVIGICALAEYTELVILPRWLALSLSGVSTLLCVTSVGLTGYLIFGF
jgi:hypothetical protein